VPGVFSQNLSGKPQNNKV